MSQQGVPATRQHTEESPSDGSAWGLAEGDIALGNRLNGAPKRLGSLTSDPSNERLHHDQAGETE